MVLFIQMDEAEIKSALQANATGQPPLRTATTTTKALEKKGGVGSIDAGMTAEERKRLKKKMKKKKQKANKKKACRSSAIASGGPLIAEERDNDSGDDDEEEDEEENPESSPLRRASSCLEVKGKEIREGK